MTRPGYPSDNAQAGTVGDATAIIEAARIGVPSQRLALGEYHVMPTPTGVVQIDLTGDKYRPAPQRKIGTAIVSDVESFAAYWEKHSDENSEIYADRDGRRITAVLDAHQGAGQPARFREHSVILQLVHSPAWKAWTGNDNKAMTQAEFAEFLEDNRVDVLAPTAAEMMEIATTIQGVTKAEFVGGVNLANGSKTLTWAETTAATAGVKKNLTIPGEFTLKLLVFEGAKVADQMIARFRYRASQNNLALLYKLDRPIDVVNTAFEGVIHDVKEATGADVLRGKP